jgi:hypothetical protein
MAYSIQSINEYVLPACAQSENSSQLDTIFFSDFHQNANPTTSVPSQGAVFYAPTGNGGAHTSNTSTHFEAFGITYASGVVSVSTGTTSNSTGYAGLATSAVIIPGIPTPDSGLITKYEAEILIRTDSTIHGNSPTTNRGYYRFGFMSSTTNTVPADGVYFEFLCDGTTTDTNWNIVFRKDGTQDRVATTTAVTASKTYRLYLCVERDTAGNYTTTYKVKNTTDNTNEENTAAPTTTARYPSATGDYMGIVLTNSKITTTSTTARLVFVDYIAGRIRRPVTREILIFS